MVLLVVLGGFEWFRVLVTTLVFLDFEQIIQIKKTEFSCAALKTVVLRTR